MHTDVCCSSKPHFTSNQIQTTVPGVLLLHRRDKCMLDIEIILNIDKGTTYNRPGNICFWLDVRAGSHFIEGKASEPLKERLRKRY